MKTRNELMATAAALNKQALLMLRQAVMLELQAKMMEEMPPEVVAPPVAGAVLKVRGKPGRKPGAAKAAKDAAPPMPFAPPVITAPAAAQTPAGIAQAVSLLTGGGSMVIKPAAEESASQE